MSVDSINSSSSSTGYSSGEATASQELGKEDFLKLLVTQLNYQDPLNPMDNEAFIAQLAQFSSLEQLMSLNSGMNSLAMAQVSMAGTEAVSFIGKEVKVLGNEIEYDGTNPVELNYELGGDAEEVTIRIYDENDNFVKEVTLGAQDEGMQSYTWDGLKDDLGTAEAGKYHYEVTAKDAEGANVETFTYLVGIVDSISYENGYPELVIGDKHVTLADVVEVLGGGNA